MTERSSQTSASGVSHVDALPPGTRLAEFEILALLGVGGFGMVYKAFDHSLHRAVAIKEYMPSALAGRAQGQSLWVRSSSDQQTFQAGLASFVGEARLLAQFDHPSLVKVFRFWEANNTAYMVMPLYSGMTFKQARVQMRTPPPEAWLRKVLWSVVGALQVLHEGKTLHRDISPDNIFLQDYGPPVLLDLGAARHAINDQGRQHTAVLKVNYAPIEQYSESDEDLRQGPWSDLYSLAAVVHGCLCNDTPLPATLRSIRDRMVPFSRVAKTVKRQLGVEYSAPFVAAISQALALRPEDRPQSIEAFLHAMEMESPPEGVADFDFRADLGDIWVEPADQPGPGLVTPTVDVTSAPKIIADIQAQTEKVLGAQDASAANEAPLRKASDVDASYAASGPDTVVVDAADTVFMDPGDTVAQDDHGASHAADARAAAASSHRVRTSKSGGVQDATPRRAHRASGARRSRGLGWGVVLVASLLVVGAAAWWTHGRKAPAQDDIITELAQPAAAPPMLEASAPDMTASEPLLVASEVVAAAASAAAVDASPVSTASAAVQPAKPTARSAAAKKAQPEPAPAPQVVEIPPPPPPPPPEPKPRPTPVRAPSPQEVCANASFFAKPMCIHQECQKPSQAGLAICVETRKRYEADEQRARQMSN
ncbi:serine/threonine-protein kinase [Acidovorax sp. 106]|uniref:serine/threonine protein kinase n=1 Tax=Acidovorax sp. 106 TaxID=2135637 RepID=UPI000EAE7508|nr:serine/threonine-protein kinase [Acidovorax sp. 106]RLJ37131.1 serine/threonine protein kinase [Acidovorax sp. 106]